MPDQDAASPSAAVPSTPETLTQKLAAMRAAFAKASTEIEHSAAAMRDVGAAPDYRLVQSLGDCHRGLLHLRNAVIAGLRARGEPVPPPEALADLRGLAALVERLEPAAAPADASAHPAPLEPETTLASFSQLVSVIELSGSDTSVPSGDGTLRPQADADPGAYFVYPPARIEGRTDTASTRTQAAPAPHVDSEPDPTASR